MVADEVAYVSVGCEDRFSGAGQGEVLFGGLCCASGGLETLAETAGLNAAWFCGVPDALLRLAGRW